MESSGVPGAKQAGISSFNGTLLNQKPLDIYSTNIPLTKQNEELAQVLHIF